MHVELNRQPGRLSMAATTLPEPGRVPATPQLRLQHQVILALDLGQTTGWAVRNADGVITHGTVQFRPGRHEGGGMPFLRFRAWLQEVDETVDGIDAVFLEEVIGHRGAIAAQVFGGFLAHLSAWAEMNKIPYEGVPVGTIKRHITGKGNATKEEVIAAVRAKGFSPVDDNDADALALLDRAIANRLAGGEH
jgi:Holliday junction resolvasome RuvABC endonuclease subunit